LCACTACSIRIFEYNHLATIFFPVRFKPTTIPEGPLSQNKGPHHFNRSGATKFILSPLVLLERVQHRLTRMIPGLRKMCYEDRLGCLDLWTLEERRNRSDLWEVFRMFKGLSLTPFNHFFTLNTSANTRSHSAKIVKNRCRLDLRLFFFLEG